MECQKGGNSNWIDILDERLRDKSVSGQLQKYQKLDIPENAKLLFVLSQNELVYVPTKEEIESGKLLYHKDRIYRTVSFNKKQCFCINSNVAVSIVNKVEYTTSNKMERAITGEMIKEVCVPIKVDRLGNITRIVFK
jgi:CRISPR-associated endonuclease Csn1